MTQIKAIRERLGLTQDELGAVLGCTQGNVGHYERGQSMSPERAAKLIEYARKHRLRLSLEQVYGLKPLPAEKARA